MDPEQKSLHDLRKQYEAKPIDMKDLNPNPLMQLNKWLAEAIEAGMDEPNSMVLSTVDRYGRPSSRTLLLKGIEEGSLVFYTNYDSRKSDHMRANPYVSALFLWIPLARQIRVSGEVRKVSRAVSKAYFQTRPRGSQIGAWASPQSEEIPDREWLENRVREVEEKFRDEDPLPLPENWGGYALSPDSFEFWQGQPNRLHDRFRYTLTGNDWEIVRLAP